MKNNRHGCVFEDGQTIIHQGDLDNFIFVIQTGLVGVVVTRNSSERIMANLAQGTPFGEMALFDLAVLMATVGALGEARVLSIDRRNLMRRIHEGPSLVCRMLPEKSRVIVN